MVNNAGHLLICMHVRHEYCKSQSGSGMEINLFCIVMCNWVDINSQNTLIEQSLLLMLYFFSLRNEECVTPIHFHPFDISFFLFPHSCCYLCQVFFENDYRISQ